MLFFVAGIIFGCIITKIYFNFKYYPLLAYLKTPGLSSEEIEKYIESIRTR